MTVRLCRKTRSGFERPFVRLAASGSIDDRTNIACFAVFARQTNDSLSGLTTGFPDRASFMLTHFRNATGHPTAVIARRHDAAILRFIFLSVWAMVVFSMAESLPDYPAAVSY